MEPKETNKYLSRISKMYICGPTVYNDSHLGHARTYIMMDVIYRTMTNIMNLKTHLVMNITDIDDKIIKKSVETGMTWMDIAKKYEKSFFDSMSKLNVQLPNVIIRVSEVLPQIIAYIQKIMDNGFAYVTGDGSIYFDSIEYIKNNYNLGDMIDDDEYHSDISRSIAEQKKNKRDFALWKGRAEPDIGFDAEFNYNGTMVKCRGRPGWHIECSCMINETIGEDIDIHLGGIDLKFPHHHNEMIQANAYHHPLFNPLNNNKTWCKEFMHIGHLCIDGLKMSKSLKNFITIDDALKETSANQLRWMFITHKWRDQMEYSNETIKHAKIFDDTVINFFNRVINFPFNINDIKYNKKEFDLSEYYYAIRNRIISKLFALEFDASAKLLSELISKTNIYLTEVNPNEHLVRKIYKWIMYIITTLGFIYENSDNNNNEVEIMKVLIDTRSAIRSLTRDKTIPLNVKKQLFEILDVERNTSLKNVGIILQDTQESSLWHKE